MLDPEKEAFMVHIAIITSRITIHPERKAQITLLKAKKTPVLILAKYLDFANVFSKELAVVLLKHTKINTHTINLEEDKQPSYRLIYSLRPVELEILKTYIETHLKTRFIWPSKSPADTPIMFDEKLDGSLRLYVDYWGLNNLTIKNRYSLPLIGKSLDRLGQAKRFTQLDLISTYHQMRIKEGNEWKTAFQTKYGHFKYQVMPFGLSNAPASFQSYINKILAEKFYIFVIMYLDDIFIYICCD